jgi:hypothetical protein
MAAGRPLTSALELAMKGSDDRLPSRHDRITSAACHPELVSSDLALPPQPYVSITSVNRCVVPDRIRWTMRVLAIVAVPVLLALFVFGNDQRPDSTKIDKRAQARACIQWHLAASMAVSRLVQSTREADLAQAGDALFRMRRARRNCDAGWVALACQDYHAIAAAMPGHTLTGQLFSCARLATSINASD